MANVYREKGQLINTSELQLKKRVLETGHKEDCQLHKRNKKEDIF